VRGVFKIVMSVNAKQRDEVATLIDALLATGSFKDNDAGSRTFRRRESKPASWRWLQACALRILIAEC